ncbi:MAG: hypothetical protein ACR2RF_12720 [Geminicoccaceae bacterium]
MLENTEGIAWSTLTRPLADAAAALGRLSHMLETSPLHPTWLWREMTRVSVAIAQANGHHAKVDQLRLALIGAPIALDDNTSGLAAAKRIFLASAPLFRRSQYVDSYLAPWPQFWSDEPSQADGSEALHPDGGPPQADGDAPSGNEPEDDETPGLSDRDLLGEEGGERLMKLVRDLAAFAHDGQRPALINLLVDLRKHAATKTLPPPLVRIAMPLALTDAGLVAKAAPGLLGGRRLPLGFSRATDKEKPLTDWLADALEQLAKEAGQSRKRLAELTSQHQSWHAALMAAGFRKHARAPRMLDLLAATPVLNHGLVASHLNCSHAAAGQAIRRLVDLGVLIEQTSRARHKIYLAGDLPTEARDRADIDGEISVSAPLRPVDVDALNATLDSVFADLDRQTELAKTRLAEAKG